MTEIHSLKINIPPNAQGSNTDSESEARILTQEKVDEQFKIYITHLTKQLGDLTRLTQGMSSVHRLNFLPKD